RSCGASIAFFPRGLHSCPLNGSILAPAARPPGSCPTMCLPLCRLRLVASQEGAQTGRQVNDAPASERKNDMTWWKTTLLITVAIAAAWAPHRAIAAPLRIPAMAYPQGAQITYRPTFANAEM